MVAQPRKLPRWPSPSAPQGSAVPRAPRRRAWRGREGNAFKGVKGKSKWQLASEASQFGGLSSPRPCWRVTNQLGVLERPRRLGRAPAASSPAGRLNAAR
uniref:Uncharacterized protein n=1 Tax=Setaria italica TaxID=4555 RepID=K3ZYD9_SETIT